MSERWDRPFYCTTVTARVVCHKFGLNRALARIIDPWHDDGGASHGASHGATPVRGVEVWAVDANHCPGAVQFLFRHRATGDQYLHSGDVRFCAATFRRDPVLRAFAGRATRALYLDTTYCHPRHTFPKQAASIRYVVDTIVRREAETHERGKAIFLISSYVSNI
jgi:Cft2 family RNA processing exonuclease